MVEENAKIVKIEQLNENVFSLFLQTDAIHKNAMPGQFVHVLIEGFVLRRPFAICNTFENGIRIVFLVKGNGTRKLKDKKVGEYINLLGPLGKGFKEVKLTDNFMAIGGGIGIVPLLFAVKNAKNSITIAGFKTRDEIILKEDFEKFSKLKIYTDDGSFGEKGYLTNHLEQLIQTENITQIAACGPKQMLEKIAKISNSLGVFCEISLEERMACGIGACLGCHVFINKNGIKKSAHVCKDGPVFNSKEVLF